MVLLQVHSERISFFPLEGDAPRTVDVQAVSLWGSSQRVEVEAGNIQFGEALSVVENVQPPDRPGMKVGPDSAAGAGLEQLLESSMPEASYHCPGCNTSHYTCQPFGDTFADRRSG
jgi:hypothetical protein